ncbi:MAG TPA: RNA methyltransferase [Candidatus Mcinerneyibacteriales bacterium]|jgi:TrmH family RNA methyltransferase|nr:RNA methyltransferase [Candidatus Mcinerneyibacteriales bacterium]HPE20321.1 RNA methyltransferase [Candidatus Mcinerneyibacteriales bacterium]
MTMRSDRIQFALIRTFDSGNIGSSFRALSNMGFRRLWVIDPLHYDEEMVGKMAAGTKNALHRLITGRSLEEFASEVDHIYALTARPRKEYPQISLSELASSLSEAPETRVGLLFGNETNGLNNDELRYISATVSIPTSPVYPSLNLAHAVLLTAFSLSPLTSPSSAAPSSKKTGADALKKEELFENLFSLISSHLFQKEITADKNRTLLRNTIQKWPLSLREWSYLNQVFLALKKRTAHPEKLQKH